MAEKSFDGQNNLSSQAETWADLSPSNTVNFSFIPKAICIGAVSGSFVAVGEDDGTATFYGNAGQVMQIRPKRINAGHTVGMTFVGLKK